MKTIGWIVFEHIINIFQGLSCTAFLFLILHFTHSKLQKIISYLFCSALVYLALTLSNRFTEFEGIGIFVYSLILLAFSVFLFDGNILKKIIISIIPVNALAVGSIVSTNLVSSITGIAIIDLMTIESSNRLLTVLISNAVFFMILAIIVLTARKNNIELEPRDWKVVGIIIFISIITFYFIYNVAFEITTNVGKLNITFAVLGLTVLNIAAYVLLISLSRKNKLLMENMLLKQQIRFNEVNSKEIKRQYEQLNKLHHDFNNTLNIIQSLNSSGKGTQIDSFISEYLKTAHKNLVQIVTTDNDYINAILNSKISEAKSEGIEIVLSVVQLIGNVNTVDICSLLGNMFDNAIEACKKCNGSKKIILDIAQRNGSLEILMKNTINSSVLKDNPTLISSKSDRENHGYGIKIINEISERNHGIADFYESNDMFCCHVIVSI